MSDYYTSREVAESLNVSMVCLCLWRQDGLGPKWHKRDYRAQYPADQFREYLEKIGTIPAGMTNHEKGQFFKSAHGGATVKSHRVRAAESAAGARKARKAPVKVRRVRPVKAIDPAIVTDLSTRVASLERIICRMVADARAATEQTKPRRKRSGRVNGVTLPTVASPDCIPY